MGTQNQAPVVFFMDSHYNYSNNQHISKQQGIKTPQWKTRALYFFDLKYYNFNLGITIDNSHILAVLPLLSLSLTDFSSKCSLPPSFFRSFAFCLSSPFYNFNPYSYHYNYPIAYQSLRDIFLNFIGFLPTFILEL